MTPMSLSLATPRMMAQLHPWLFCSSEVGRKVLLGKGDGCGHAFMGVGAVDDVAFGRGCEYLAATHELGMCQCEVGCIFIERIPEKCLGTGKGIGGVGALVVAR